MSYGLSTLLSSSAFDHCDTSIPWTDERHDKLVIHGQGIRIYNGSFFSAS